MTVTHCQLASCGERLSEDQQRRGGKFCRHEHAIAWQRETGYYDQLAKQGIETQMKYFKEKGRAIGAENRRKAMKRVVNEQKRLRKLAGARQRREEQWKSHTRAEYRFIVECQLVN